MKRGSDLVNDEALQERLWKISEDLVGEEFSSCCDVIGPVDLTGRNPALTVKSHESRVRGRPDRQDCGVVEPP